MAASVQYGMGQLRYSASSASSYMTPINCTPTSIKTQIISSNVDEGGEEGGTTNLEYYQDVLLQTNQIFNVKGSYLLHLAIPMDLSYDCIYQIKLIPDNGQTSINTTNLDYQLIKYVTIPQAKNNGNTSRVILYPIKSNGEPGINNDENNSYEVKVAIAKTLDDFTNIYSEISLTNGEVLFDNSKYWFLKNASISSDGTFVPGDSIEISNKNDSIMEHVWTTSNIKTDAISFDIIFSPRSSNISYSNIYIQMVRTSLDQDIYKDGIYGRKMDISQSSNFDAKIYELNNLIGGTTGIPTPLINIGVHSHPNLLMAINGEEIRIGQSGYYELNNFKITSLGIAASDINDKFTVDYQWVAPE